MEYPRITRYGEIGNAPVSVRTVIESANTITNHNIPRTYRLVTKTAGYESAGSMARWTDESHGVTFELDGCTHGQWYKSLDHAKENFDNLVANGSYLYREVKDGVPVRYEK